MEDKLGCSVGDRLDSKWAWPGAMTKLSYGTFAGDSGSRRHPTPFGCSVAKGNLLSYSHKPRCGHGKLGDSQLPRPETLPTHHPNAQHPEP